MVATRCSAWALLAAHYRRKLTLTGRHLLAVERAGTKLAW
jgi:hypothetical protein